MKFVEIGSGDLAKCNSKKDFKKLLKEKYAAAEEVELEEE